MIPKQLIWQAICFCFMFSACMPVSFNRQKFTELKQINNNSYTQSIYENKSELDDTLLSPYSIELTINNGIQAKDPIYLETEKGKYKFDQPKLEMKTADICGNKLIPILTDPYPKNAAIIYATEDDIVDDTCIYLSDIDEVFYKGQISQQLSTKVDHSKLDRTPHKTSEAEPTMFPLIWILLTTLFGILTGIMYWRHEQALASSDCFTVIIGGFFYAMAAIAFGVVACVCLVFFIHYLTKFIAYNKKRRRA